jgi:Flp pilus assembly protein TadG
MAESVSNGAKGARFGLRGLVRRFRREENAASAVEFAIIAVPFLGILMAIFESTFLLFNAEIVDAVTANVSRQLMTGQIQTNGQTCAQQKLAFQNMICPTSGARPSTALPSNFDCSKVIIDVRQSNLNNVDETNTLYQDPTQAQFTPATSGQNNIIRVIYPMTAIMPIITGFSNGSIGVNHAGQVQYNGVWSHIIMGTSVFRTEPYGSGGGGTC